MLQFLFRRLTRDSRRGAELFAAVAAEARRPHWFIEGEVPDTLDGRFAMLATITALVIVRLERSGEAGDAASVALTERFIEAMETDHREMGIGDPKLGRTVRKLVGSLARRVDLWRTATAGEIPWHDAVRTSVYKGEAAAEALDHSARELQSLWAKLERSEIGALGDGRLS